MSGGLKIKKLPKMKIIYWDESCHTKKKGFTNHP